MKRHSKAERILRKMIAESVRLKRIETANVELQLAKADNFGTKNELSLRQFALLGASRYSMLAELQRARRNALCAALRALRTP